VVDSSRCRLDHRTREAVWGVYVHKAFCAVSHIPKREVWPTMVVAAYVLLKYIAIFHLYKLDSPLDCCTQEAEWRVRKRSRC
jgi:hypothetical protein